jgi:transposase
MKSQRRAFTPEFKDEAVKLVVNTGRPVAMVARELGLIEQTPSHWVKAYRDRLEASDGGLSESERIELLRLRKENNELKLDRAFLKKASLYWHRLRSGVYGGSERSN